MDDISDRLARLAKRDELAERTHAVIPIPSGNFSTEFIEVIQSVGRVVRLHPAITVTIASEDGGSDGCIVQVSGVGGEIRVAVVRSAMGSAARPATGGAPGACSSPIPPQPGGSSGVSIPSPASGGLPGDHDASVATQLADMLREDPGLPLRWSSTP